MMALTLILSACAGGEKADQAEELVQDIRADYIAMTGCTAHMDLTADYGTRVFAYGMDLSWQKEGETVLTITSPDNVAGTSAHIAAGETALEFDGVVVETGPLDGEGLSPIDAAPALLESAREGYISECVLEDWDGVQRLHVMSRDPEKNPGEGREIQLWFAPENRALLRGEIAVDGLTVIQCEISNFQMEKGEESSNNP